MIAPKAPGHTVRSEYMEGKGTPALVAVYQDYTGHCLDVALAYGAGIGAPGRAVMEPPLKLKPKPTCSANRPYCAAVLPL